MKAQQDTYTQDAYSRGQQTRSQTNPSLGALITNLARDVAVLVRDEAQLAKTEMSEKTGQVATGIGSIAAAGAVLMCGFLVLLAAAVYGLNTVLPPELTPWLSALIVGGVVCVIGLIMLMVGKKKLQAQNLMPQHTIDSFRHDRDLAQHHNPATGSNAANGSAKEQTQ